MVRVVIWEDNPDHIPRVAAAVEEAGRRAGVAVDVVDHRTEWPDHIRDEIVYPGHKLWLVDIKTDLPQKDKKKVESSMMRAIDADPKLKELYRSTSAQVKAKSHAGLYVAMMASAAGVKFMACSHYGEMTGEILAYLATGDRNAPQSQWMVDKGKLTQATLDLGDVSLEVNRLGEILRSLADEAEALVPTLRFADAPVPDPPERDGDRRTLGRTLGWLGAFIVGTVGVIGVGWSVLTSDDVKGWNARRELGSHELRDGHGRMVTPEHGLQEQAEPHELELTVRTVAEKGQYSSADMAVYVLNPTGKTELLVSQKHTTSVLYPRVAGKTWSLSYGFYILIVLTEDVDPKLMKTIEGYWTEVCDESQAFSDVVIDYDLDGANNPRKVQGTYHAEPLPRQLETIVWWLEEAIEDRAVDDFRVIGFSVPLSTATSPNNLP